MQRGNVGNDAVRATGRTEEPFHGEESNTAISIEWVLVDQLTDTTGFVEHPLATGPFGFDVLTGIFLYLESDDRTTLLSVSGVSIFWRYASNLLPHWRVFLEDGRFPVVLPTHPAETASGKIKLPQRTLKRILLHPTRNTIMEFVREVKYEEQRKQQVESREKFIKDIMSYYAGVMAFMVLPPFIAWLGAEYWYDCRRGLTIIAWIQPIMLTISCVFIGAGVGIVTKHYKSKCSSVSAEDLGLSSNPGALYATVALGAILAVFSFVACCARLWVYSGLPVYDKKDQNIEEEQLKDDEEKASVVLNS